jgi:2-polyprenyl-3-methyl-5-hydroxy-6-metoxy-1,4-benzoquinol methylase
MKNNWNDFFKYEAHKYDDECFTKNTEFEAEFLHRELGLPKQAKILDVGCGTGRHSVRLSRMRYHVTGIDQSEEMLKIAREKAANENATVECVCTAAESFCRADYFDGCICLCEGALSLFGNEEIL